MSLLPEQTNTNVIRQSHMENYKSTQQLQLPLGWMLKLELVRLVIVECRQLMEHYLMPLPATWLCIHFNRIGLNVLPDTTHQISFGPVSPVLKATTAP